eukprot:273391-Chlamydomonas_euryale.AAC.3
MPPPPQPPRACSTRSIALSSGATCAPPHGDSSHTTPSSASRSSTPSTPPTAPVAAAAAAAASTAASAATPARMRSAPGASGITAAARVSRRATRAASAGWPNANLTSAWDSKAGSSAQAAADAAADDAAGAPAMAGLHGHEGLSVVVGAAAPLDAAMSSSRWPRCDPRGKT